MKLATTRSPKFRRLMNAAGLTRVQAAGTLELLWLFTMEQAPAGDVGRWSDADIEAEFDWEGEPGALVEALVASGWLDRCSEHRLVVHDWADHMPDFLQKRAARGKMTVASASPKVADGSPCQPNSDSDGQTKTVNELVQTSPDKSGLVPVREEKRSQEKPRQEKAGPPMADGRDPDGARAPAAPPPRVDPPPELPDPRPLLNLIASYDGEPDEKSAWLQHDYPLIHAEAAADPNPKRIGSIAIRYYRAYLKGPREFRGAAAREETRRRMAAHEAECLGAMLELEEVEGVATAHR